MARRVTELETDAMRAASAFLTTEVVPLPDSSEGAVYVRLLRSGRLTVTPERARSSLFRGNEAVVLRPRRDRPPEESRLVASLHAVAADVDEESELRAVLKWKRDASGLHVHALSPPGVWKWRAHRRRDAGPDLTPWRLGAFHGPVPSRAERLPAEAAALCEPPDLLHSLVEEPSRVAIRNLRGREVTLRGRGIGELPVPSGTLTVVQSAIPIRKRPMVVEIPPGSHPVHVWTEGPRWICTSAIVVTVRGPTEEIVTWALAGNPSRRIRKNPWCPRTHHYQFHLAVTDAQLVTDLQTVWAQDVASIERMGRRLDKLSERAKTSIVVGVAADSPPFVNCPDGAPEAPAVYVGLAASGAVVAVVIALDDLAGGLQRWRP